MSKKFCLLFSYPLEVVHFGKETVKIPEIIGRHTGWEIEIVRHGGVPDHQLLPIQRAEAPHVTIRTLPDWADSQSIDRAFLGYLARHARTIDVLMLMNTGRQVAAYGVFYKLLNPKGFLWNKLDLHEEFLTKHGCLPVSQTFSPWNWLQQHYGRVVDLITAESQGTYQIVAARNPEIQEKLRVLHCGIDPQAIPTATYHGPRESIILNVARLGNHQKATEVLIEAFADSGLWSTWKLALVGPIAPEFESWLSDFARARPEVWAAMVMPGAIQDRQALAEWFARSKVFCMPSRYESWGLSLTEAGFYGCAPVSTDFCAAVDMLDGGRCGELCAKDDVDSLSKALLRLCMDEARIQEYGRAFQERVLQEFTWDRVIKRWLTLVDELHQ